MSLLQWCNIETVVVAVTACSCGWSSEALELHVECERVRPLHVQGRYGVVSPITLDIVEINVSQIRLAHHTIGRRHLRRFQPNATSFEDLGDDHCGNEPSRCGQSWKSTFRTDHLGETCTSPSATRVGLATGTADKSSPCSWFKCVIGFSLCCTNLSSVVS